MNKVINMNISELRFNSEWTKSTMFLNKKDSEKFLLKNGFNKITIRKLLYKLGKSEYSGLFTKYELGFYFLYKNEEELVRLLSDLDELIHRRGKVGYNEKEQGIFCFSTNFHPMFSISWRMTSFIEKLVNDTMKIKTYKL